MFGPCDPKITIFFPRDNLCAQVTFLEFRGPHRPRSTFIIRSTSPLSGCEWAGWIPPAGWGARQPGPHVRAAELRSGRGPSLSGVKPAWTDTLRHLISSPHSWDGTLPTPCVKQFKPDSSSSPLKIFAGLSDSRSSLLPLTHLATVHNPSQPWLLRASLRPPTVLWWFIFNPSLIWTLNKLWLL